MEEQQIILEPEMAVIGGGAVTSVNGYTGDVVLTTSDLENTSDYQTGSEVEGAISIEATAREAADNNLQTQIDAISASSDVTDIVGTYAELQNYDTSKLGDNDIIKVLQDESQNGETTYYRWSTTTQSFTLIGEEGPYYTKAQADVLLNAKQDTLTAGTNIQISNNTISATDTTYSNFTGTDGVSAGTAGLVPAPATTDAGKFLKADGTWEDVGGGATELTANDYNWPTGNPDGVAPWLLESGLYFAPAGVYVYTTATNKNAVGCSLYIASKNSTSTEVFQSTFGNVSWSKSVYDNSTGNRNSNGSFLTSSNVVQTTGTSTTNVMSQNAVTGMIYASGYDPSTGSSDGNRVAIGGRSTAGARTTIAIGAGRLDTSALAIDSVALGEAAAVGNPSYRGSVALGSYAVCTAQGQVQIGSTQTSDGYNSSNYRLLTGLYDPQSAHDAATKGYVDAISSYSETEADTGATWIDGKTIYKKSYQQTITSNTQTFSLGITNLYEVVKMEAIWHAGGTLTNGMPTTTSVPGDSSNTNSITVLTYGGTVEIDSNGRSGMKGVITIYYTKSS